ncbi:MAG: hypothetical protein OEY97_01430 [Nitrospirota bacterium]|nr:hypothetical protein [Nitrospirota bacterium]
MHSALIPVVAVWLVSFTCYLLAGFLIWKRRIGRTPHIVLTIAGFMADFIALFFQFQALHAIGASDPSFAPDADLKSLHTVFLNLSMGMYCVTAMFGFFKTMGWYKISRFHVPVAFCFLLTLLVARVLFLRMV